MVVNWLSEKLVLFPPDPGKLVLNKKVSFNNLPFIFPDKKLCLFFSAKSGCTFATNWFFYQQGLLEEALEYDPWIHWYRIDVYYKEKDYREKLSRIFKPDYTLVKLVRSPYQRAVSSYIHAIRTKYVDAAISDYLGREVNKENKFTFEEFVLFLEETGVENSNLHHRTQVEKLERDGLLNITKIIKLEESIAQFRQLEKEFGLKQSDLNNFSQSRHHRNKVFTGDYSGNKMYTHHDRIFGDYRSFYNDSVKKRIADLYACDFKEYEYNTDEL